MGGKAKSGVSGQTRQEPGEATRYLDLVLGDQLDRRSPLWREHEPATDRVWMAEAAGESTHVPSHRARIVLFLAAMRHFARDLTKDGFRVDYQTLDQPDALPTLAEALERSIRLRRPQKIRMVQPGDYRVMVSIREVCARLELPLEILEDTHFFGTIDGFARHARGRKQLRQEYYYRELRQQHQILLDDGEPCGGQWNFDKENRQSFGKQGPVLTPEPASFPPDEITREVIDLVNRMFPKNPGETSHFAWPVTAAQAQKAAIDFLDHRLADFGLYQDAMWTEQPYLHHSLLSSSLNLKLLDARWLVEQVEKRYRMGQVGIASAEGYIRQILGWREYVRGVYWHFMPEYLDRNDLGAELPLPSVYWTGQTDMKCLAEAIGQTLKLGYAHHIQRLMVTGLFALLFGVRPREIHEWYLAVYVDAVEWVELPNTLGMSQAADGGVMGSKPYTASGKYIDRMSNYCRHCRYRPDSWKGEDACPMTVLYWDFLLRHEKRLATNPRMVMQVRNVDRFSANDRKEIRAQAGRIRLRMV